MRVVLVVVAIAAQALFTTGDLLARSKFRTEAGITREVLYEPWFFGYLAIRQLGTFGQVYVLAHVELGRTAGFFAMASVLISNALGVLLLNEFLGWYGYIGIALAVCALALLAVDAKPA